MTNKASARFIAFEVLADVLQKGEYSNLLLPRKLRDTHLEPRDRAFTTELVYGTLRMQGRLDFVLSKLSHRQIEELELPVLVVLRIGLYQLQEMQMPSHAAIFETVELAKSVLGKSTATFINAILRSFQRTTIDFPSGTEIPDLAIRYSHPEWVVRALSEARKGAELSALLEAQNERAAPVINCLPDLCQEDELQNEGAEKVEGSQRAFSFDGNPGDIPAVREHRALVQDLGSQIVVEEFFSTADKNSADNALRWLDLCAGPGGKAGYLDALIVHGEFVANEISEPRAKLVANVLRRGRVTNVDGREFSSYLGTFDRILIDAPCSGLGALRRRPEVRWRRTPEDIAKLQHLQRQLLGEAAKGLNSSGIIGYATCSPHLTETKLQVKRFLLEHPNFVRVSVNRDRADSDGDLQLWTDLDGTDCMYLALLRRTD